MVIRRNSVLRKEYLKWFRNAQPGDRLRYRWGHNQFTRSQARDQKLKVLMTEVAEDQERGDTALFQDTDGMGYYEYFAVRLSPRSHKFLERISCRQ